MKVGVTILVFVKDKGEDPAGFLDKYWEKTLEKTGVFKKNLWRCVIDFDSLDEFNDYQPYFSEQLSMAEKGTNINIDVGVYLPTGFFNKSLQVYECLSSALTEAEASFQFSLYECDE